MGIVSGKSWTESILKNMYFQSASSDSHEHNEMKEKQRTLKNRTNNQWIFYSLPSF